MNRTHFLKTNVYRGFTLIELLVVIAIIGLLSTVIAGPINDARKKGRDAKKIGDLNSIQLALTQYGDDNAGTYPNCLAAPCAALTPKYLNPAPNNALAATLAKDKYMYVYYYDTANTNIIGYHIGVQLEYTTPALQNDADCNGTTCNPTTGNVTNSNYTASGAGNPAATAAGPVANAAAPASDFGGAGLNEALGNTCAAILTNCIYDQTQ